MKKGVQTFRIIMHYPETIETRRALSKKAAAVHAQTVIETIQALTCPVEQKAELIDAIGHICHNKDGD